MITFATAYFFSSISGSTAVFPYEAGELVGAQAPIAESPPNANPGPDCASRTGYRRLGNREIEAAIVDNTLVYDWRSGIYRAVRSERFHRRRNRYRVRYHGQLGGGSYEITGGRLCTRELNDSAVLCRRMFQSSECGYALSDPGADFPRYRVTIDD